jgi:hypothetical protein
MPVNNAPRTNAEIRKWYLEQVAQIPELNEQWLANGFSAKERAKRAWQIRHEARLKARKMMANAEEVEMLRARDIAEYGNENGPGFEYLIDECRKAGLRGNNIYEAIIKGSYRTNKGVNEKLKL